MELFAIGICALCAVLFAALVQKTNKEYALLISLGTAEETVVGADPLGSYGEAVAMEVEHNRTLALEGLGVGFVLAIGSHQGAVAI